MTSARFQADFTGRAIRVPGGATSIGAATARMSAAWAAPAAAARSSLSRPGGPPNGRSG